MYQLTVYYPDDDFGRQTIDVLKAADVLLRIPTLLAEHTGCAKLIVTLNGARLFSVDCAGNRLD